MLEKNKRSVKLSSIARIKRKNGNHSEITTEEKQAEYKEKNARLQVNPKLSCIRQWKSGAKSRGIVWNLTEEYLLALAANTTVCPVFGFTLTYDCYTGNGRKVFNPCKASLDRIDNSLGYVEGNVWIISDRANRLKRDSTLYELKLLVAALEKKTGV